MEDLFVHKEQVAKNIIETTLNKGAVEDAFKYDNEIKYPKTGKEIKSNLAMELTRKATILQEAASKAASLKEYISCEPMCDTPSYNFEDKRDVVMNICPFAGKIYDDNMCYLDRDMDSTKVPRGFVEPKPGFATSEDQAKACREYNNLIRMCCSLACEISFCKSMHDNIDEKKTYQLNAKQLSSLKF